MEDVGPLDNQGAVEVSTDVGGARAIANEARLRTVIASRAACLATPRLAPSALFQSFLIGGFECAAHRRRDGRRLDLVASTRHQENAAADYAALATHGLRTVRDGLRWHLIETAPGIYDWSSFLPMLRAARETSTQVIWDLCHWGWPDDLDIWSPAFVDRFGAFAGAAARLVREETDAIPFYVPVNEMSFWAWAGGSLAYINPWRENQGGALKDVLIRASIAAIEAVRHIDPRVRIVSAEPVINVAPRSPDPADVTAARQYSEAQFEALDFLSGRSRPELGGRPDYVDVIGLNYYLHNQWVDGDLPLALQDADYRPFRDLIVEVYGRYGRPLLVAETGIEGELRSAWLRMMAVEVEAAQQAGVPVEGLCLYPVTDYPGWDDDRHCPTGLLGYAGDDGRRPVYDGLAQEVAALLAEMAPYRS